MNPSNPHLVAAYRQTVTACELFQFTWIPAPFRCKVPAHIHHIFSVRRRWDLLSNIVHISSVAHDWCHHRPIDGRILAMLVKVRKGELNPRELRIASGMNPAGWLAKVKPTLDWMQPYYDELTERLDAMA